MVEGNPLLTLAKTYELLSSHSEDDFRDAATIHGLSPDLRKALCALADARNQALQQRSMRKLDSRKANQKKRRADSSNKKAITSSHYGNGYSRELQSIILDKKYFKSTSEIIEFLRSSGLPITAKQKESRQRLYSRVIKSLDEMEPRKRRKTTEGIIKLLESEQTSGWFRVIRGESD